MNIPQELDLLRKRTTVNLQILFQIHERRLLLLDRLEKQLRNETSAL